MNEPARKFDHERYFAQIETMSEPVIESEIPKVKLDLRGIREYTKSKGVAITSFTEEEKQLFCFKVEGGRTMTDITYRVEGDYLIPNIIMDDEADDSPEKMIGRYGMMRESFLREHRHGTYTAMLLMGKLTTHLREVDRQAEEVVLRQIVYQ